MKIDSGLLNYIRQTGEALNANPVRTWPAYDRDTVSCWRYIARCFGHGLAVRADGDRVVRIVLEKLEFCVAAVAEVSVEWHVTLPIVVASALLLCAVPQSQSRSGQFRCR